MRIRCATCDNVFDATLGPREQASFDAGTGLPVVSCWRCGRHMGVERPEGRLPPEGPTVTPVRPDIKCPATAKGKKPATDCFRVALWVMCALLMLALVLAAINQSIELLKTLNLIGGSGAGNSIATGD